MPILFQNKSALPLECISTFGVSAKDTDSPIGYFGTGLKYAIAVLLREGCTINIFIDGTEYNFRTELQPVRNKEFGFIYMNDVALPFTVELGKNWQLWQAYRELYSNCMDEGGNVDYYDTAWNNETTEGTFIDVTGLDEIHQASNRFILRSEPKHRLDDLEIHESVDPGVFYKGIRVLDLPTKYTYNILSGLSLTEDRTVSQYSAESIITTTISDSEDLAILMDILSITDEKYHEAKFNWNQYHTPSDAFMKLAATLKGKSHALNTYYGYHEPSFLGKLSRAVLSDSVTKKLNKLRASVHFQPDEIFLASMSEDFKIIDEGLVLRIDLLTNPKRLNFAYRLACHKMKNKKPYQSNYDCIVENMLGDFDFSTIRQKRIRNSHKKAA